MGMTMSAVSRFTSGSVSFPEERLNELEAYLRASRSDARSEQASSRRRSASPIRLRTAISKVVEGFVSDVIATIKAGSIDGVL
jgi:hypothetical protein